MREDIKLQTISLAEHYAALQLPEGSSREQVQAQYRRLAKVFHPDRNPGMHDWCEEQMRRVNEAYRVLSSDVFVSAPPQVSASSSAVNWPSTPPHRLSPLTRIPRNTQFALAMVLLGILIALLLQPTREIALAGGQGGASHGRQSAAQPADPERDAMTAQVADGCQQTDATVTQAVALVTVVNNEVWHVPNSQRVEKADQLEADELELVRLESVARMSVQDLQAWSSTDIRQTQITDIKMALFQMQQQRALVSHELNAFPEE